MIPYAPVAAPTRALTIERCVMLKRCVIRISGGGVDARDKPARRRP